MKKILTLILLSSLLIMQSCVLYGKKDALSLATTIKQKTELDSTLTSVNVSNNVVTIQGSGFSNVTNVKLTGSSLNADLNIDSKSDSQIIASAASALSLLVGETFNLIIGTADAQVTYTVTFTLQNGAVQLSHLSSLGATTAGQILKFNGTSWAPAFLAASQNYLGTWNATTYLPDITTLGSFNPGDYYIVDTAGTYTSSVLTTSPTTFAVGNWVMFNGSTWDKVFNGNLSGSGTANFIPYYSSSNVLANSPMSVSGSSIGIGTATPGSSLDIKGTLRLSGATSGFVGLAPAAVAGGTTYTLPAADGTNGQVLTTNASGVLSWTSISVSGGTVTGVTSANADIGVASGTTAPVLTLNSGTSADQIVKLTAAAKLPAVDGSLLTNLASTSLVGAVAVANGGTGATTLGASQSALGITLAGPLTGNVPALGATVIADRLCASDSSGGTISCINNLPAATVRGSVSGTSGTGNLLFATSPTISSPVITNIAPATDFTLTQNSVVPFTSVNTGAVANTLYLSAGKVGIGTATPAVALDVNNGSIQAGRIGVNGNPTFQVDVNASYTAAYTPTGATTYPSFGAPQGIRSHNSAGADGSFSMYHLSTNNAAYTTQRAYIGAFSNTAGNTPTIVIGQQTAASAYSERMRIDTSGNVGIGTNSPSSTLEVKGSFKLSSPSGIAPYNSMNPGSVFVQGLDGTTAGYVMTASWSSNQTLGGNLGGYRFGSSGTSRARIEGIATENWGSPGFGSALKFSATPNGSGSEVESMRIQGNGNVGIGTTGPTEKLDVVGNIKTSGCLYYASSSLGTCASDERIKKDIHPFDLGLDALLGINPVQFKYNGLAGFKSDGKKQLGVIAQDVEKTSPELIKTQMVQLHGDDKNKTEIKVVDYGAFTYIIINSIKELYRKWFDDSAAIRREIASNKAQIDAKATKLEAKAIKLEVENTKKDQEIAKLKNENEEIKAQLQKIEKMIKKIR